MKTNQTKKYLISASVGLLACLNLSPLSAVDLTTVPVIVALENKPNIMFIFDTSGSMNHIVVDAPYNASTTYGNCPASKALSISTTYSLSVASDGTAKISGASGTPAWTNNSTNKCFNASLTYNATLYAASGLGDAYQYKGNYLNWYFSNSTGGLNNATGAANFGVGAKKRPDAKTRIEVAQAALSNLVTNSITKAYVGLTQFESDGANVVSNLADIDTGSYRTTLLTTISGLSASGGTPLSSTLAQMGRYFAKGDRSLTFTSPSNSVSSPQMSHTLFKAPQSGEASKEYILSSCQKNFTVTMTDGLPTSDTNYTLSLGAWVDGNNTEADGDFDDIAAALYDIDLRPDLTGKNNIISYVIGFEQDNALLQRAGTLGGGQYLTATNSSGLSTAFASIVKSLNSKTGAMSSVTFNSSQLEQGSAIYQAKFNTGNWYGALEALPLDNQGNISTAAWEAGALLDTMTYTNRKIFTYDNVTLKDGIPFAWTNLNTPQKNDLRMGVDANSSGAVDDTDAQNMLAFISGDRSKEGATNTTYRTRKSRLGDLVSSSPIFVGKPQMSWPEYVDNAKFGSSSNSYSSYKNNSTVQSRTPMVYVGANDGMLHGFGASLTGTDAGNELFAYIPGLVYSSADASSGLHYLASQQYQHRFYVDLTPSVSDVFIKTSPTGSQDWRTVLVGGLQAGGKGLFALDVSKPSLFSNPSTNAKDIVLWEFDGSATTTGSADMGYVYGSPTMAMMANGKWAVISPNGYNSTNGHAVLFIIFLEEGLDGAWTAGTDYIALDTGVGGDNGLSTPRLVDYNGDSVVDLIYAGDIKGNLWTFDVSSSSAGSWTSRKLFTATDSGGTAQPITSAPIVAANPNDTTPPTNSNPNVLVMFGTGKYLETTDNSSKSKMAYYTVWDKGGSALTRSSLQPRTLVTNSALRTISGDAIDWTTQYGWYIDLLDRTSASASPTALGERVVADSLLRRQVLFFNTIIPDSENCTNSGSGWLMNVQYDTGLAPGFGVFDANNDGLIDSNDIGYVGEAFTDGMPTKSGVLGEKQYTPGTNGAIDEREIYVGAGSKEGLLSWHEIFRN